MIVREVYHPTETTRFANILLPGAVWAEAEGIQGEPFYFEHDIFENAPKPGVSSWKLHSISELLHRRRAG